MTNNIDVKFFSNSLTGNGKNKVGLLNIGLNPINRTEYEKNEIYENENNLEKKKKKGNSTEKEIIPIAEIPEYIYNMKKNYNLNYNFKNKNVFKIAELNDINLFIEVNIEAIYIIRNTETKRKKVETIYQIKLLTLNKEIKNKNIFEITKNKLSKENLIKILKTNNLYNFLKHQLKDEINYRYAIDQKVKENIINKFNVFENVEKSAYLWNTEIDNEVNNFLKSSKDVDQAIELVKYLENYNIPLELYKDIYKTLEAIFDRKKINQISNNNSNLLILNNVKILDIKKGTLSNVNSSNKVDPFFSNAQKDIIKTNYPLTQCQAGAGVGKSKTMLGRIDYMIDSGVNPKDILVLSFTNAAAVNIKEQNEKLNSYTIDSFIHTIYKLNFKHRLSSPLTLINSIDIYCKNNPFANDFKTILYNFVYKKKNAPIIGEVFIKDNYKKVIKILNRLNQTTLELENIICYIKFKELKEPNEFKNIKHIIVDESQDNSLFQHSLVLKLADVKNASLMMVGDSSQTLYEFRNSSPKALNLIESTNSFKSYKLETNYRSNQQILDFANTYLEDIEANKYAKLRLRSPNEDDTTNKDNLYQNVKYKYYEIDKIKDINEMLPYILDTDVKGFIDEAIKNKKEIAFLAYTKNHVRIMEAYLKNEYENLNIKNITPPLDEEVFIFSTFIKKYEEEIETYPTKRIMDLIEQKILDNIENLISEKRVKYMTPYVEKHIKMWKKISKAYIEQRYSKYLSKQIKKETFIKNVKENMIGFEIKSNKLNQLEKRRKNEREKENNENVDIILSTIHSAKGLEYDYVVLLHKSYKNESEEDKRMNYVALTRAKEKEFIISYGNQKENKIKNNYEKILEEVVKI